MDALRVEVLLSLQMALLGEVFPTLRQVRVTLGPGRISIYHYVDGPITDEDRESISAIETQVIADFPETFSIVSEVVRIDSPAAVPKDGHCVYARREL